MILLYCSLKCIGVKDIHVHAYIGVSWLVKFRLISTSFGGQFYEIYLILIHFILYCRLSWEHFFSYTTYISCANVVFLVIVVLSRSFLSHCVPFSSPSSFTWLRSHCMMFRNDDNWRVPTVLIVRYDMVYQSTTIILNLTIMNISY